jgi:spore coat protein U-like protein
MGKKPQVLAVTLIAATMIMLILESAYATCYVAANTLSFGMINWVNPPSTTYPGVATVYVYCTDNNTHTICVGDGNPVIFNPIYPDTTITLTIDSAHTKVWGSSNKCLGNGSPVSTQCPYSAPCQFQIYGLLNPPTYIGWSWGSYSSSYTINGTYDSTAMSTTAYAQGYVMSGCTISANQLSFGNYVPGNNSLAQSLIHVNCSSGSSYHIGLSTGINSTTYNPRILKSASGSTLNYNLYLPDSPTTCSSYTNIWQNSSSPPYTGTYAGTGTGSEQNVAVCGKIPQGQTSATAGNYIDTITVTLYY